MRRKYIIVSGFVLAALAAVLATNPGNPEPRSASYRISKQAGERFIVTHPFNLNQIGSFSKYRSCMGHSFSGSVADGEEEAHDRSLKHYVTPLASVRESGEEIPIYAPFEGEISDVEVEQSNGDSRVWLTPNPNNITQWHFIFFHVVLDNRLREGSGVSRGEQIGRVRLTQGGNFDIAVKQTKPFKRPAISPPFEHFSAELLADYEVYGVKPENITVPKEYREQNPCPIIPGTEGVNALFPQGSGTEDQVTLKQNL